MRAILFVYIILIIISCNKTTTPSKHKIISLSFHTVYKGEDWSVVYGGQIVFSDTISVDTGYYLKKFSYVIMDTTKADTLTIFSNFGDSVLFTQRFSINQKCDSVEVAISMPFPLNLNPFDSLTDYSKGFNFGQLNKYNSKRLLKVYPKEMAKNLF